MLPQALGYDRREAFNGENHHENHLKFPIGENHLKIEKWQIGENYHGQLQIESLTSISSSSLFVSSLSLFGYGVFMPGGADNIVFELDKDGLCICTRKVS